MQSIEVVCLGYQPASKGSYKAVWGKTKTGKKVSRLVPMDKHEAPWRKRLVKAIAYPGEAPYIDKRQSVIVRATYYVLRPASSSEATRRKPNVKPDLDKLARAFHDALTDSGLIADDSLITSMNEDKEYVDDLAHCGVKAIITWERNGR